jgi:hypothetical protein
MESIPQAMNQLNHPPLRNLQSYKSPGIELIFPTVPCPRGSQAKNELVVITTNEQEGWPCLSPASELHSVDTLIEGTCRTGFCFYVSESVTLNMRIEDSRTYSYLLSTTLKPGLNLLAWCKESILEYGGEGVNRNRTSGTPRFSLLFCCNGMSLTYRPVDLLDMESPYKADQNHKPLSYQIQGTALPPSITVLSKLGTVPSLLLFAKLAAGGEGILFERVTGLAMDNRLANTTFHSLANRIETLEG